MSQDIVSRVRGLLGLLVIGGDLEQFMLYFLNGFIQVFTEEGDMVSPERSTAWLRFKFGFESEFEEVSCSALYSKIV